ncbi:hypothetical protein C5F48_24110 [Cereibacter changlensis JA139]|uniref:Uncharacterized protein n=1 Tax=Cereibacter changlensis JA139 TaxID=1188249 RepID=A0A2T4JHN8_9RHOB|nr:hypothetical protein C5F48_24110 [Cereibacter changlensis JA139]
MPGCVMAGSPRQSGRPPRREGLMSWLRFRPALLDGTRARPRPSAGGRPAPSAYLPPVLRAGNDRE